MLIPINRLIEKFPNEYQFCNGDAMLLRKVVNPYEYMVTWERLDEISLLDNKDFYSGLYLEDITDKDYTHAQKVFKELKPKNFGDYHDLYDQSDTLMLTDVFENLRNKCIEIYELDPAHIFQLQDQHGKLV